MASRLILMLAAALTGACLFTWASTSLYAYRTGGTQNVTASDNVVLQNCGLTKHTKLLTKLPIKLVHGIPVVSIRVNGIDGRQFLVDSGSEQSIFNSAVASHLKVTLSEPKFEHNLLAMGYSAGIKARDASPLQIDFGRYRIKGDMLAMDLTSFGKAIGIEITGVIGSDILSTRPSILDYRDLTFGFSEEFRLSSSDNAENLSFSSNTLDPIVYGRFHVENKDLGTVRILIDTGNNGSSVISARFAFQNKLDDLKGWKPMQEMGFDQPAEMMSGLNGVVELGSKSLILTELRMATSTEGIGSVNKWDIFLGSAAMRNSCLLLDVMNKRVHLTSPN